jgi:gliding motility-associated-like protein
MPLITTTYLLAIEDSNGCLASDTITVMVNPEDKTFFAPNAFTPNNDGNNDLFKIYALGVYFFDCQIFDRWGEKVFDWQNINEGWDGIYKGKPMPPGVYVYQVHLNYLDGVSQSAKGSVTLIK